MKTSATQSTHSNALRGNMGVMSIVMMVIATAAPLTVMVANTPLMFSLGNGAAAPMDAILAMGIMFLFSVGFVTISAYIGNAGAFYACIQKGLGRVVGLGSATLAMITYSLFQLGLVTYIGFASNELLGQLFHLQATWWLLTFCALTAIGWLGYSRIELSSKFLGAALLLEVAVVVVLNTFVLNDKGIGYLPVKSFQLTEFLSGSPGMGILFAIYSFIGFESTVIYREEARNPERTIPIATYTAVFTVGVFCVISMWCAVAGIGADQVVAFATAHPGDMYQLLAEHYLGRVFSELIQILLITSLFACSLSLHNIVVRYGYILGKHDVLPRSFSYVHERHGSPYVASLVLSAVAVTGIGIFALLGLDPVTQIYTWGATAGTLGYMVILAMSSSSVLVFFYRSDVDKRWWHTRIAPMGGLIGILACLSVAVRNLPMLIGGDNGDQVAPLMGLAIAVAFAIGGGGALALKYRSPMRYAALRELA